MDVKQSLLPVTGTPQRKQDAPPPRVLRVLLVTVVSILFALQVYHSVTTVFLVRLAPIHPGRCDIVYDTVPNSWAASTHVTSASLELNGAASGRVLVEPSLTEEYFTVEARFFLSDESLADSISVHFEPKGNSYALAIDTPEKLQAGECIKAELTVRVPKQEGTPIALFIRSQNAAIVLNNLTDHAIFSSVHLAARNGAVKVHGLHPVNGALDVSVENGAVTLHETATQSVAVKLQNGPLKLSDASVRDSAAFEVRNGGITGYLTATGAQNQTTIQAGTYNAAVDLHVDGTPKSVSATSHNGAARVHLPLHFWGTFDAATKRGRAQVSGGNDLHFGPPDKNAPWGSSHKAGWKGEEGGPQGVRVQTINGIASIVFTD